MPIVYVYVMLNAVTRLLPSILPRIFDLVRLVVKSEYYSKMDIPQPADAPGLDQVHRMPVSGVGVFE